MIPERAIIGALMALLALSEAANHPFLPTTSMSVENSMDLPTEWNDFAGRQPIVYWKNTPWPYRFNSMEFEEPQNLIPQTSNIAKRAQSFVRFGKRAQTFVRFGRTSSGLDKRGQSFVRFG